MKKIVSLILSITLAASLYAQTTDDALLFAQEHYEGTARSMAMGNAFTALGGDLGAIGINPASSGVFRFSQFTFTPSLTTTRSTTNYLGMTDKTRNTGLTVSNFGTVISFDTGRYSGLLNYNFGFVYNRKNSYRSKMTAHGSTDQSSMLSSLAVGLDGYEWTDIDLEKSVNPYANTNASWPGIMAWNSYLLAPLSYLGGHYADVTDAYFASTENYNDVADDLYIPGMLDQQFRRRTYGGDQEFSLNFGGNFNDILYFGANLNFQSINRTIEEYYEEKAQIPTVFDDGFVSMDNSYWLRTRGSGINFQVGLIVTPVAGLRLGATVTTPTWYNLTDEWDYTMNSAFTNSKSYTVYSPTGTWNYKFSTPMRWSVGAAYTFWDRGLISVDYESTNYGSISSDFQRASVLRTGAELRLGEIVSLRGGYQYYTPAVKGGVPTHVYSAGVGFNFWDAFSVDLAWNQSSTARESFQLYEDYGSSVPVPTGSNAYRMSHFVCTFGLKF